jgi:hypothetical protein
MPQKQLVDTKETNDTNKAHRQGRAAMIQGQCAPNGSKRQKARQRADGL